MDILKQTDAFLREIGMHPEQTDIERTAVAFRALMEAGLRGETDGLPMLPAFLRTGGQVQDAEPVLVADAGGTNLRRALVCFRNGQPVVTEHDSIPMPGSREEIGWDEFLTATAAFLLPLAGRSRPIAFCFSYPFDSLPDLDGRLRAFNKEVRVRGSAGRIVGAELLSRLRALGGGDGYHFLLLNDATASAMGGLALTGERERLAGLVLGTGFNICCPLKGEKIRKLPGAADMLVNFEAGSFDGAQRGEADRLLDENSEIPGDHLLEKMFAGAYHGELISLTASLCAGAGLLSERFLSAEPFALPDAEAAAMGRPSPLDALCRDDSDAAALRLIAGLSFDRAARLLCACLLAVVTAVGGDKNSPFRVALEGSTIVKSPLLRGKLERLTAEHIAGTTGKPLDFITGEHLTLTGSAAAALLCGL